MRRNVLTIAIAMYIVACSSVLFADEPKVHSTQNEIRDIKRLLVDLNTRVQKLEEQTTAIGEKANRGEGHDTDLMWQLFGVRLEEINREDLHGKGYRYRGGMKVIAVRPHSPAARERIQVGDIIVGMHLWETVNEQNINFILANEALREKKAVKFCILRNGEALFTQVEPNRN